MKAEDPDVNNFEFQYLRAREKCQSLEKQIIQLSRVPSAADAILNSLREEGFFPTEILAVLGVAYGKIVQLASVAIANGVLAASKTEQPPLEAKAGRTEEAK